MRILSASAAVLLVAGLAACASSSTSSAPASSATGPASTAASAASTTDPAPSAESAPPPTESVPPVAPSPTESTAAPTEQQASPSVAAVAVPQCDAIVLEVGADVTGEAMGQCIAAGWFAVGSGRDIEYSSEVDAETVWSLVPELRGHVAYADGVELWVAPEGDWARVDGRVVSAEIDPDDSATVAASGMSQVWRGTHSEEGIVQTFSQSSSWVAVGEEEITDPEGIVRRAWRFDAPAGYTSLFGSTVDEHSLWLHDGLLLRQQFSSSFEGYEAEGEIWHLDYGTNVEIPAPPIPE